MRTLTVDDLVRSVIVKILHSVEGGDVEHIIVFPIAYTFSLYSTLSLHACLLIMSTYLQVFFVLKLIFARLLASNF